MTSGVRSFVPFVLVAIGLVACSGDDQGGNEPDSAPPDGATPDAGVDAPAATPSAAFEVRFARLDSCAAIVAGSVRTVSPDDGKLSGQAHVAFNGAEYAVVYLDDRNALPDRRDYFSRVDANGNVVAGSEVQ